jgi:hypothetical protein
MDLYEQNNQSDNSYDSDDEKSQNLKKLFKKKDYLECEKTKEILEAFHLQTYFDTAEKDIKNLLYNIDLHCQQTMSSALKLNRNNEISGKIVGIVYKHIQKKYDFKIFEKQPELANPLLQKYEEKKSRREYKLANSLLR